MPESKWPMITVEDALATVMRFAAPLAPAEVSLEAALGRVLARDLRAAEDMPPFRASSVDGFAVRAADGAGPRRILGEQTAGQLGDLRVTAGGAARITTGAPVPEGADAVVMVEQTEELDGEVHIRRGEVRAGDNVRPIGQDIQAGDLVLTAGQILGAAEIGVLAAIGQMRVPVVPAPTVAVLSTGDELVEPGTPLGPGQIRDSNRYSLMAAARQAGAVPLDLGIARDEPGDLEARVRRGLAEANVFVSSGGVSMGHLDLVKPLLETLGDVHFGRIYMKPGKPLTFATVGATLAFALPGNPVSSLVGFELFVRPALRRLGAFPDIDRPRLRARLAHDVRHTADRTEYQRAIVRREGDAWVATTTGFQGSARLLSLVGANALLILPYGVGDLTAGAEVEALALDTPLFQAAEQPQPAATPAS